MSAPVVRRLLLTGAAAAALVLLPAVHAQSISPPAPNLALVANRDWTGDVPAHLWAVDGVATLERDGRVEGAEENTALVAGDRLRTDRGRVEVLFDDGSALDIDEYSRVDLLGDSLVRLLDGRIRLTLARSADNVDYRVDTVAGSALIRTAGEYRISIASGRTSDPELHVRVFRGQADITNAFGRTSLRAGYEGIVSERRAPSPPYIVNSAQWDAFDRWVENIHAERLGTHSTQYLPSELRNYGGSFDQSGSWDYLPSYGGYVWYPQVAVGWRPYSVGRWSFYGNFGWFWVGAGRWTWPTHHYGRWGLHANRWYWVPDRHWAPAWVAWGGAPGYTSWCPLGYDGRPVVGFSSVRYVDPWVAWTVVPTRAFVNNVLVTHHAVGYRSIAPAVRSQFEVRRTAPSIGNGPVTRAQPLRAPTTGRAVVRDGRAALLQDVVRSAAPAVGPSTDRSGQGRTRPGDAAPASRQTNAIDATRGRSAAPMIDPGQPPTRSRIQSSGAGAQSGSTRLETPGRVQMPSQPEPPRVQTPQLQVPPGPQARPREDGVGVLSRPSEGAVRTYRSREPQSRPPDDGPASRVYRSREPAATPNTPSHTGAPSRIPDRTSPTPDRSGPDAPAMRSRPSGGEPTRAAPPQGGAPRVESRPPASDSPRSAPPSRTGPDYRSSPSPPPSSSSSGRTSGQAVRRGGGR